MAKPHQTRAWRKLRDQVVAEEPVCWMQLEGCTILSQTADHIVTVKQQPELAMDRRNLRGACHHCNAKRNDTPADQVFIKFARPIARGALGFFD